MQKNRTPILILALALLAGCQGGVEATPTCGDGSCDPLEQASTCPQDCQSFLGRVETTYLDLDGTTRIAVQIASPVSPRYPEGSGVVVVVPPVFDPQAGLASVPDFTSVGLIQVTFLWPGSQDPTSGMQSDGVYDYGGDPSRQALRAVIRFAAGRQADKDGRYLVSLTNASPQQNEVGLYASGDAGLAALGVLSWYGDELPGLAYYVGRENPTVDSLICQEVGFYDTFGRAVQNPFYQYPASYGPWKLTLTYPGLSWEESLTEPGSPAVGRPYLDLDASGSLGSGDYLFSGGVPVLEGKLTYSAGLTQALVDSGVLTLQDWPVGLATPQEAVQVWSEREASHRFEVLRTEISDLKVMLVFGQDDHAQVARDKPHIHQLFQGFRFEAELWVRLNPDRAYVLQLIAGEDLGVPDNPANTQPVDWLDIAAYAYPNLDQADYFIPLAAVTEMADRAHTGRWDENLGQPLYTYTQPTPQP